MTSNPPTRNLGLSVLTPAFRALSPSSSSAAVSPPCFLTICSEGGTPVYKELSREGTLSTSGHFVMWIELPSDREDFINEGGFSNQAVWVKAGVAVSTDFIIHPT